MSELPTTAEEPVSTEPTSRAAVPTRAQLAGADPELVLRGLNAAWREVKDSDTPTLLQLMAAGGAARVDAESNAGYLAAVTDEDTWRVFNLRRDLLPLLVATLTGRSEAEVQRALAQGPGRFERVAAP